MTCLNPPGFVEKVRRDRTQWHRLPSLWGDRASCLVAAVNTIQRARCPLAPQPRWPCSTASCIRRALPKFPIY